MSPTQLDVEVAATAELKQPLMWRTYCREDFRHELTLPMRAPI